MVFPKRSGLPFATFAVASLLLLRAAWAGGGPPPGDEKFEFNAQLAIATDPNAAIPDREKALTNCMQGAHLADHGNERLAKGITQILKELEKKKADAAPAPLAQTAFRAIDFTPFSASDLGTLAKPYLSKDTDGNMRLAALAAIEAHSASGISAELLAIFTEGGGKTHDSVEIHALGACMAVQGVEAEKLVKEVLKTTKSKPVRLKAISDMADLYVRRPSADLDADLAIKTLMEFASATYPDPEVAYAAAISVLHWGSYDGIGQVIERAKAERRGPSRECYRTVCFAAHKLPAGFVNVSPETFLTSPQHSDACGEMYNWWDKVKGSKPDATLFDALREAGITIPKDTSVGSKEAIGALIDGLAVPNRALRYQAFDMLVKRTGPSEFSKEFKRLVTSIGGKAGTAETEKPEGYPEGSAQATQLYELQKERSKKWRTWWDQNSGKANLVGGVWKIG